jgi:hypothetical protein
MGLANMFGAELCPPGGKSFVREPDNEIALLTQTGVVLRQSCHLALLFGDTMTWSDIGL